MISVSEAFVKFKGRLELTKKEQDDASRRQKEVREYVRDSFKIDRDILSGSYARATKTKPLKDIDIFFILNEEEDKKYRSQHPSVLLGDFERRLKREYGQKAVSVNRRSITVDFGILVQDDESGERVLSIDIVPAFERGTYYEIADTEMAAGWVKTDPEIHKEKATVANEAFSGYWKPIVKMIKKWNERVGKPIKPSFLVEVMAIEIFNPPFSGGYPYELKSFFSTAAQRISDKWEDPAGLGPPVSDQMTPERCKQAAQHLKAAERIVSDAIRAEKQDRMGEALQVWRNLFGSLFPLS